MTVMSTADGRARPLTEHEHAAVNAVGAAVAALGLLGFVNSFAAVEHAAWPSFGPLAPTVPLGIDLGIAIFAALDIVLARLDMRPRWVRLIPWTLTGATVYLNVATQGHLVRPDRPCGAARAVGRRRRGRRARGPGPRRAGRGHPDGPYPPVPLAAGPGPHRRVVAADGVVGDLLLPGRSRPGTGPAAGADRAAGRARHVRRGGGGRRAGSAPCTGSGS